MQIIIDMVTGEVIQDDPAALGEADDVMPPEADLGLGLRVPAGEAPREMPETLVDVNIEAFIRKMQAQ